MASSRGGRGLYTRRTNMSLKISGFQYIHLLSSTVACEIISWKELSPVFSLTHWMPLGENIENPEDDPIWHVSTLWFEERELFYQYISSLRSCS